MLEIIFISGCTHQSVAVLLRNRLRVFGRLSMQLQALKKQYRICYARDYRSEKLYDTILKCDTVFIYNVPVRERTEIMEYCYRNMRTVYISPEISDIVEINSKHVIIDDISLISAPVKELSFEQKLLKRIMDILLSMTALLISSPVLLLCAVSIKICDGGKIIFKQRRATKDGKVFKVYNSGQ